jgi:hypothetical protein
VAKNLHLLRLSVLEHLEGLFVQVRNQLSLFVGDAGVKNYKAGVGTELRIQTSGKKAT